MIAALLLSGCGEPLPRHAEAAGRLWGWFAEAQWAVAEVDDPMRFAQLADDRPNWQGATCFRAFKDHRTVLVCVHGIGGDDFVGEQVEQDLWRDSPYSALVPVQDDLLISVSGTCYQAVGDAWCLARAAVGATSYSCEHYGKEQFGLTADHPEMPLCEYGTGSFFLDLKGERRWIADHSEDGFAPSSLPSRPPILPL